jgi:hypothetical protein
MNEWEQKDLRITRIAVFKSIFETCEKWTEVEKALAEEAVKWIVGDTMNGVGQDKFIEMIDSISIGGAVSIDDFEGLNEDQSKILQAVKRAYKRSDLAKSKEVKR